MKRNPAISFEDLPLDLRISILARVNVKTLICSTIVAKSWYDLVKDPRLIKAQHDFSLTSSDHSYLLLCPTRFDRHTFTLFSDKTLDKVSSFGIASEIGVEQVQVQLVGSCNGLLCVSTDAPACKNIYLYNPFIKKSRFIGFESSCYTGILKNEARYVALGFGYCAVEHDYRVVRLVWPAPRQPQLVEMYSLKSGKWKIIGTDVSVPYPADEPGCVVSAADGRFYWLAGKRRNARKSLICFDFSRQELGEVKLPDNYVESENTLFSIMNFKGRVCVAFLVLGVEDYFSFWVLKRDGGAPSWEELKFKRLFREHQMPSAFTGNGWLLIEMRGIFIPAFVADPNSEKSLPTDNTNMKLMDLIYTGPYIAASGLRETLILLTSS